MNAANVPRQQPAASGLGPKLLLSLITFCVLFGVTELGVRLLYHPENLGTVIQFDANLGWSLTPNAYLRSVDHARGFDYEIAINSLGMREREFDVAKPMGKKRVVILGDSFAFGTGIRAEWRFSDIMGRALRDEAEVLNAAVCGWGTDQQLLHYESFVSTLAPDVVILTFMMANDVINNTIDHLFLESAPKPRFKLSGGELLIENHPLPAPGRRALTWRSVLKKSRVLLLVKRRLDARRYRSATVAAVAASSGVEEEWKKSGFSHWSVYEHLYPAELERGWHVTEAILRRLADRCARDGAELIVLAFPIKIEVDLDWRARLFERTGVEPSALDLLQPYDRLRRFCEASDIEFIYPLDAFRVAAQRRPLYFRLDGHPNEYGHTAAARVLLERLQASHALSFRVDDADRARFGELSAR